MVNLRKARGELRRGGVTVEAALLTPLLIMLLFGIIEFGLIFKDLLLIHQAAREGARVAAVGASTYEITDRVMQSAPTLTSEDLSIQLDYRTYDTGIWSAWGTLSNWGSENDAPANAQVRVQITYLHPLACGPLFARWFGNPGDNTIQLTTGMVMCREE
jgi:Flp pilus assembly protein TadG